MPATHRQKSFALLDGYLGMKDVALGFVCGVALRIFEGMYFKYIFREEPPPKNHHWVILKKTKNYALATEALRASVEGTL